MNEREAFEKFAILNGYDVALLDEGDDDRIYDSIGTQEAYDTWLAALAYAKTVMGDSATGGQRVESAIVRADLTPKVCPQDENPVSPANLMEASDDSRKAFEKHIINDIPDNTGESLSGFWTEVALRSWQAAIAYARTETSEDAKPVASASDDLLLQRFKDGKRLGVLETDIYYKHKVRKFEQELHPDYSTNDTPYISYSRVKRLINKHFGE